MTLHSRLCKNVKRSPLNHTNELVQHPLSNSMQSDVSGKQYVKARYLPHCGLIPASYWHKHCRSSLFPLSPQQSLLILQKLIHTGTDTSGYADHWTAMRSGNGTKSLCPVSTARLTDEAGKTVSFHFPSSPQPLNPCGS